MDNEGLLEWAEHEVDGAWEVLMRAVTHRDKLRKVVEEEKDKEAYDTDALTLKVCDFIEQETERMKRENTFETIYGISPEEYYGYENAI